jgi:hypothetical protein
MTTEGPRKFSDGPSVEHGASNFFRNEKENAMKKSLNITFVLVAFVIGLFLSPVMVSRADGGDLALIHACVKDRGGDVKIVGANSSCTSGYSLLHWGIAGPQGPQGEQGLPGPASLPSTHYQTIAQISFRCLLALQTLQPLERLSCQQGSGPFL